MPKSASARHTTLFSLLALAGILLFAANLRGPFTAAGAVLEVIQASLHIGAGQAGLLLTLPVLAFCVISPFAAPLARLYGLERVLFGALLIMIAGIAIRSTGSVWMLYTGTIILGGGIALGNTLVPSLLKRDYPNSFARLTGVYAITMGLGAAAASTIIVPLTLAFDWQVSLGSFILLPAISALVWWPRLKNNAAPEEAAEESVAAAPMWRSPVAWQVTLFFGCTSFNYYAFTAWLPSILVSQGYSQVEAGNMHGLLQLCTAVPGLLLPLLIAKAKDQRAIAAGLALSGFTGVVGLYLLPAYAVVWVTIFGIGMGGAFIMALMFIGLRTRHSRQTARLSGMTQSFGYMISACGPVTVGLAHDLTGAWLVPFILCGTLCLIVATLGLGAGRARYVDEG